MHNLIWEFKKIPLDIFINQKIWDIRTVALNDWCFYEKLHIRSSLFMQEVKGSINNAN